jgi:hypothetical protein
MAAALTNPASAPVPEGIGGSRFVLAGRPLAPALLQRHQAPTRLNFTRAPATFVPTLRDLFAAMLSGKLPLNEPRPKMMSIRRHFTEQLRFTHWVAARPGQPRLADLTLDDFAAYALHLHAVLPSEASREVAQSSVRMLYRYRTVLPGDRLTVDPLDCEDWGQQHPPHPRREHHPPHPRTRHGPAPGRVPAHHRRPGPRHPHRTRRQPYPPGNRPPRMAPHPSSPPLHRLAPPGRRRAHRARGPGRARPLQHVRPGPPAPRRLLHPDRLPVRDARQRDQAPAPRQHPHPARRLRPPLPVDDHQPRLQGRERPRRHHRHLDHRRPGRLPSPSSNASSRPPPTCSCAVSTRQSASGPER